MELGQLRIILIFCRTSYRVSRYSSNYKDYLEMLSNYDQSHIFEMPGSKLNTKISRMYLYVSIPS